MTNYCCDEAKRNNDKVMLGVVSLLGLAVIGSKMDLKIIIIGGIITSLIGFQQAISASNICIKCTDTLPPA